MAQNKSDMQKSFDFLKDSGGTELKNSTGIKIGNTTYKPSESGKSIITTNGDTYTTHREVKNAVNGKK
jgi:hypothetical protein